MSIACKSNGIFNVLYKVRPQVNNVVAIPLDALANAILPSDQSFARIRLIKKILLVPPRASKNTMPPSFLSIMEQKQSYTSCWSVISKVTLCSAYVAYVHCSPWS